MPAFTVTSVDTTANTLTSTGVAAVGGAEGAVLQTGDRLRLRNVGGALPAATPSLAAVTDYFAVRVSDDAIKLSDTNAHALAGTNIVDLTGSGSGTTTIEFGLPYCLPTASAAAGTQIKSVNDRTAWASLVALYDLLTGQAESVWSGAVKLAGALTVGGATTLNGTLNGPIAAATIAPTLANGNNNDFAPTGFANAIVVLAAAAGAASITGMAGGAHGRMVYVVNTGGTNVTITHQDASSSAANRFLTPTAASIVLTANQGTMWMYDTTTGLNRWRLMSKNF